MVGWTGKLVFIKTIDNKYFQGKVISETDKKLTITDKFGCMVVISIDECQILKEEYDKYGN